MKGDPVDWSPWRKTLALPKGAAGIELGAEKKKKAGQQEAEEHILRL
jgi:hypothetical protein